MPFPQIRAAGALLLGISLVLGSAVPTAAFQGAKTSTTQSTLPILKFGDKKLAVTRLQVLLGVRPITGGFFEKTKAAVEQVQRQAGLKVTGTVDAATWGALGINSNADLKAIPLAADETATSKNTQIAKKLPKIKPGDKSTAVKRLQVLLGVKPASGNYLNLTRAAVETIQRANGLKATGVVNSKTWAVMGVSTFAQFQALSTNPATAQAALPTLRFGDKSDAVKKLQVLLGVTPVTGGFFEKTRAAVIAAQSAVNLPTSAVVDTTTWNALGILSTTQFEALPIAIVVETPESIPEPEPSIEPVEPLEPAVPVEPAAPVEPVVPVGVVPPSLGIGLPFDSAGEYQAQTICDPNPKTGADRLRQLLKQVYGETVIGIYRDCDRGGTSEHKEGRALDWMYHWRNLEQRAKVESFLAWLIAPGEDGRPGANARRMGVMYVIWNGRIWGIYRADEGWRDVGGCTTDPAKIKSNYDNYCHRDHLHLSMTWDGAAAMTSYWNPTAQTLGVCEESPSTDVPLAVTEPQQLTAVTPTRILDTRLGIGTTQPCRLGGKRSATDRRYLHIPITSTFIEPEITDLQPDLLDPVVPPPVRNLISIPGMPQVGVSAVLLRATVSNSNAPSSLSIWARGAAAPSVVTVPMSMGGSASAETIAPLGTDGSIAVAVTTGAADVTIDVIGYFAVEPQTLSTTPRRTIKLVSAPLLEVRTPLQPGESRILNLPSAAVGDQPQAASVAVSVTAAGTGQITVIADNQEQLSVRYNSTADAVLSLRGNRDLTFTNTGNSPATINVNSNWYLGSDQAAGIAGIVPIRAVPALRATEVTAGRNSIAPLTNISTIPPQATTVLVAVTVRKSLGATGLLIWGGNKPVVPNIGIPAVEPRTSLALVAISENRTLRLTTNTGSANVSLAIIGWGE